LLESIKFLFVEAERMEFIGINADEFESLEKGQGRVEERLCTAIDVLELLEAREWKELKTVAKLVRRRIIAGKTTEEVISLILK
jgi:hypothetical protein